MTSAIDVTVPIYGNPTTKSVRDNFVAAHDEIGALQTDVATKVNRAGDTMLGFLQLYLDPETAMQAATKQYVDSKVAAAGGGASLTVADVPPAIANGKMWFDSASTQLYIGYDDGSSAQWVVANNIGANSFMTVADSPPTLTQGALWFDSVKTQLYVGFDDGNTKQWVIATNPNVQQSSAALQPLYNNVGRNLIHNALFQIYQRGVGAFTTSSAYTADRWQMTFVGGSLSVNVNIALTDTARTQIGDEAARTCLGTNFTGGSAAGDYAFIVQKIEGVRRLAGKTVTVSFWCNASATPKIGVNILQDFGVGGSPSAGVWATAIAITASTTWTRYSATFTLPSVAGKTLGSNNNDATTLALWLSSGATNNTVAGNIGVQSGIVNFWGIQLEVGSVVTPLEKIDPQQDFANCQRFYQLIHASVRGPSAGAGGIFCCAINYPTAMRALPGVTLLATGSSNVATTITMIPTDARGGRFEISSTAVGDCYALAYTYTLSADL